MSPRELSTPGTEIKFQSGAETERELKSKSGHTPEELFDILVSYKALPISHGSVLPAVRGSVRFLRNAGKEMLRRVGYSYSDARKMAPTPQNIFIKNGTRHLPAVEQEAFFKKLLELERDRVVTSYREVIKDLIETRQIAEGLVKGAYLIGSTLSDDCWPEDVDLFPVVKEDISKEVYWQIRNALEANLQSVVACYPIIESEVKNKLAEWSENKVGSMYIDIQST